MSILESFWQELPKLSAYELTSSSGKCSKTHWQGKGLGRVLVEPASAETCYIREEGVFTPENSIELDSRNEWLWERLSDRLRLSHVRRGRDHPTTLFELHEDDKASLLKVVSPHLCGKDIYEASAWLTDKGLSINWRISGPVKDERLAYRYYR